MSDWTVILRSLSVRRFSTVTTVATVAVAVALMLVLVAMREAAKKAFERGAGDMHLMVSAEASPLASVLNGIFYANAPRRPIPWDRYERLSAEAPWAYAVPIQQGDSFEGHPVLATSEEFFTEFKPNPGEAWQLAEGRFFTDSFEVVLGAGVAKATGLRLGDRIALAHGYSADSKAGLRLPPEDDHDHAHDHDHDHDHDHAHDEGTPHVHDEFAYKVVGILKPTGGAHDRALITNLESTWIIHAHDRRVKEGETDTTADDLIDADRKITGVYLRLRTREGSNVPANLPMVFDALRKDTSITVAAPFDEIRKLDIIVGNVNRLFVVVAGAVILSSGIAIMLALYNSMEQRRRQIAVLRVLGASKGRIFNLVLTESVLIGLMGAAAGVLLAFVGAVFAAGIVKGRIGLVVDPALPARPVVAVVLATVALAAVAGIIPAIVGYRTSVARNLRPLG